tara:strand:- start:202 stop:1734 length:1533 start_codon:yes stop_codon:yes gene_type:complete
MKIRLIKIFKSFVFLGFTLFMVFLGAYLNKIGFVSEFVKPIFLENINVIPNYFNGLKSNPQTLELIFNDEQKSKLFENRKIALNNGLLVTHDSSWVKCKIKYIDDTLMGKLRLKGDGINHLSGDKWSFRIKLKGEKRIFGMKKFSIQNPKTRNYIYEWIFHQALRRENIISLRYEFIKVVINGENKGIYALEEHFDEHLLDNNYKKNSVIVRFNEDYLWKGNAVPKHASAPAEIWQNSLLDSHGKIDFSNNLNFSKAKILLKAHRDGYVTTSVAFNTEKLSTYLAICDLMDGNHAWNWNNLKFCYDSKTKKLEPIGFDKGRGFNIVTLIGTEIREEYDSKFRKNRFFSDLTFTKKYISKLNKISQPKYLDSLLEFLSPNIEKNLSIIYKDYWYFNYTTKYFKENQTFISRMLNPENPLVVTLKNDSLNFLELINRHYLPIELIKISKDSLNLKINVVDKIIVGKEVNHPSEVKKIYLEDEFTKYADWTCYYKILGLNYTYKQKIISDNHK